jgi:beta-galactosidase
MAFRKLSRRKFIETSVAGAAAVADVAGLPGSVSESKGATGENFPGSRTVHSLNEGWKFRRQASPGSGTEPEFLGAEQRAYKDSSWATVWLPHTWDATPDNPFATSGHFRGIGWYRKSFEAPAEWQGRQILLRFKGAFQVTDVWVNGQHAGQHVGGYTSFAFDVTRFLLPGRPNLIAVKVDSVPSTFIAPTDETNVAQYGGIYRTVSIEVMNPLHVRHNGIWITSEGTTGNPVIRIQTWIVNQGRQARKIQLESSVLDAQGQLKTKIAASAEVGPGEEKAFDQKTEPISKARLWSPDSPYLYRLMSTVREGGRALDQSVTRFGIRFMGHDPADGFMLNGEPINLHGVDRRQDYGFLGDAVPEAVGVRDVHLMKEMGVNFIRTAHYPQDPAVLDACDELGILVWEEVPNIKIHMYPPSQDNYKPVYTTRFPWL